MMRSLLWSLLTVTASPWLLLRTRFRRRSELPAILVIQLGKLGDLLCTTPVFRAIRESHPGWRVHLLCRSSSRGAVEGNPFIDVVHCIDRQSRWSLIRTLRRAGIRSSVNCLPGSFASIIGLWIFARYRVNTSSVHHGFMVRFFSLFNQWNIPYQIGTSTFQHYMRLLEPLDVAPISYQLDFAVPRDAQQAVDTWLNERGLAPRTFIICNVTAGNSVKEWPEEKFAALADRTVAERELAVVLCTLDRAVIDRVRTLVADPTRVIDGGGFPLQEYGALCESAAAHVSADTGPLYVAHAAGCPLVIIQGPIHPAEQIPPESRHVAHVPPPPGCEPWVFVSLTPRAGTPSQLRAARDTPVQAVFDALVRVLK